MDNPGNPLKEFSGVLKAWHGEEFTPQGENAKTRVRVEFDFTDLEVIRTDEPYPYPITTLRVGYADPHASSSQTNRWAHLSKSVRTVTQGHCETGDVLDFLVGKRQAWVMVTKPVRSPDDDGNWADRDTEVWTLKSIEGVEQDSGGDIMGHLADLLDGKNEAGFYEAVFKDAKVRANTEIIEQATNRTLLEGLEKTGMATRDDEGVWHKTVTATA
ncbi:hypothetical protein LCGC14_1284300 [marine sediment metagenome]|uniref:Uncharacterized protein n=1 Tax=marine sediment metagenome TaxID=412755 RepID=A0A0F9LFD3_9ZZZZ